MMDWTNVHSPRVLTRVPEATLLRLQVTVMADARTCTNTQLLDAIGREWRRRNQP